MDWNAVHMLAVLLRMYVRIVTFYCRFQDGYFKTGDIAERRGGSIVLIDRCVSIPATHTGDC